MHRLSAIERRTLIALAESGAASNFDSVAISKLFTLGFVEVDPDRRLVLTEAGQTLYGESLADLSVRPAPDRGMRFASQGLRHS